MSKIRSKDTKPELLVRKFLFSEGFRYRLHRKDLPGKPDIALGKYKTAIFIHGCFWHGHKGCRYFVIPKTRTKWWLDKISRNKERDIKNIAQLKKMGWYIRELWECELRKEYRQATLDKLLADLSH